MKTRSIRNLLVFILSFALILSVASPASAVEIPDDSIEGIEAYCSITANGTIAFNVEEALNAGYSINAVNRIQARIAYLNSLVISGEAYINSDFGAVIGGSRTRSSDESYIIANLDGTTDVFLTAADTQSILNALSLAEQGLDYFSVLAEVPSPIQGYVAFIFLGGSIMIALYRSQINRAAAGGNGVRMHIWINDTTLTQHVSFFPR